MRVGCGTRGGVRGQETGQHSVSLCCQHLLWPHRAPLCEGLGKGLFAKLGLDHRSHPLIISLLVSYDEQGERIGWSTRFASYLRCSPQLCCPDGFSLLSDHAGPPLQTGGTGPLVVQLLEQGQALLEEDMGAREVLLPSRNPPQLKERIARRCRNALYSARLSSDRERAVTASPSLKANTPTP